MAETYTSNLGLTKPDYDSPADISVINSNMDKIDNAVANAGKVKSVNGKTGDVVIDDISKLNGKDAKYYSQPIELLDNPEFAIAQAGYMGQHGSKYYAADRWISESADVSVTRSGEVTTIQNNGSSSAVILQKASSDKHALYAGKPITLAICLNDDTILCKSDVMPSVPESSSVHACWLDLPNGTLMVNIFAASINSYQFARFVIHSGASVSFKWIRLIPGTYTADNLPPYIHKGYAAELAECQRYFERLGGSFSETLGNSVYIGAGTKTFMCSAQFQPKRIEHPSVTLPQASEVRVLMKEIVNGNVEGASSPTSVSNAIVQSPFVNFSVTLDAEQPSAFWAVLQRSDGATSAYIDISADL